MYNKIYILSTGRSGTSFLFKLFQEIYPELEITHQENWSRIINIISNLPFSEKKSFVLIKKLFLLLKKADIPGSTVDPLRSMAIAKLLLYDNIKNENYKIIHFVRDPRAFVTSFMNWKNSSLKKLILHYLIPFWMPEPFFDNNLSVFERIKFNKFKQFCWVWYFKNSFFYNSFHNQKNYLLVRMEDLTNSKNKRENFIELLKFLDLPMKNIDYGKFCSNKVNKSDKLYFPPYRSWTDLQKNYLDQLCGNLMEKFGYY